MVGGKQGGKRIVCSKIKSWFSSVILRSNNRREMSDSFQGLLAAHRDWVRPEIAAQTTRSPTGLFTISELLNPPIDVPEAPKIHWSPVKGSVGWRWWCEIFKSKTCPAVPHLDRITTAKLSLWIVGSFFLHYLFHAGFLFVAISKALRSSSRPCGRVHYWCRYCSLKRNQPTLSTPQLSFGKK